MERRKLLSFQFAMQWQAEAVPQPTTFKQCLEGTFISSAACCSSGSKMIELSSKMRIVVISSKYLQDILGLSLPVEYTIQWKPNSVTEVSTIIAHALCESFQHC